MVKYAPPFSLTGTSHSVWLSTWKLACALEATDLHTCMPFLRAWHSVNWGADSIQRAAFTLYPYNLQSKSDPLAVFFWHYSHCKMHDSTNKSGSCCQVSVSLHRCCVIHECRADFPKDTPFPDPATPLCCLTFVVRNVFLLPLPAPIFHIYHLYYLSGTAQALFWTFAYLKPPYLQVNAVMNHFITPGVTITSLRFLSALYELLRK